MVSRFFLFALLSVFVTSCGKQIPSENISPPSTIQSWSLGEDLMIEVDTIHVWDEGDSYIIADLVSWSVQIGDEIDFLDHMWNRLSIKIKSLVNSQGSQQIAQKGQSMSLYFDAKKEDIRLLHTPIIAVKKWTNIPNVMWSPHSTTENTPSPSSQSFVFQGIVNGQPWQWKSILNPPPYYKFWSRAMLSPDRPTFLMSFEWENDQSSINFQLFWDLIVWLYTWRDLQINFSSMSGSIVYNQNDSASDITVEITDFTDSWNSGIVSGKLSGKIVAWGSTVTLDGSWKDAKIDIWGEEAK